MSRSLSILVLVGAACSEGGRSDSDAGVDAGRRPEGGPDDGGDECAPGCDGGIDASADAALEARISGACVEVSDDILGRAANWSNSLAASSTGFVVEAFPLPYDSCVLRTFDADGSEGDSFEIGDPCGSLLARQDGRLLMPASDRVWVGDTSGEGGWRDLPPDSGVGGEFNLTVRSSGSDTAAYLVGDKQVSALSWEGDLLNQIFLGPPDLELDPASMVIDVAISWSGEVLATVWRTSDGMEEDRTWNRVWLQRHDADLQPLDAEPELVQELAWSPDLQRATDSLLSVRWDGTAFGVTIEWTVGDGDFGDDVRAEMFAYAEDGTFLGSHPVDRWAIDAYETREIREVLGLPDRVVFAKMSKYWELDDQDQPSPTWDGLLLSPFDVETGDRVGEDARFADDFRTSPMARSGNRLALLLEEPSRDGDGERVWELHLVIADCPGVFGQ